MSCELLRKSCCIHLALFFVIESLVLATFIAVDHNDSKMRRHDTTAAVTCPDQFFLLLAQLHSCEMPPRVCCPVPTCLLTLVATPPVLRGCRPICWNRKPVLLVFQRGVFRFAAFSSAVWRGASLTHPAARCVAPLRRRLCSHRGFGHASAAGCAPCKTSPPVTPAGTPRE